MKKILLALASVAIASSAMAQQRCAAGIYMLEGLTPTFYSFNTNGNSAVVVSLGYIPATGIAISAAGVGTARPSQLQTWTHALGAFDGSKYNFSGETFYGACSWTGTVSCDGNGGASVSVTGASQTVAGRAWGVNCEALSDSASGVRSIRHIF